MKAKNLISCRILHLGGFIWWRERRESSALGAEREALPDASSRGSPARRDPAGALGSAGSRSLGEENQHSQPEAMLQQLEGLPAFCGGANRGSGAQRCGAAVFWSHPSATLTQEAPARFGHGQDFAPGLFWVWGRLLAPGSAKQDEVLA